MAVKASNQITLIDLTDGYSVILTNDSYTFLGDTEGVAGTQTTKCQIQAMCGSEVVPCTVGSITTPTGLSIVSDNKSPSPTLTITATSALKLSGTVLIPVQIGDISISKAFSYSIAFRGSDGQDGEDGTSVTITDTSVTYQVGTSGTTKPTGSWVENPPTVPAGQYLWTKTVVEYSDGNTTESYSVSRSGTNGSNGTSVTITKQEVTYQVGTSGTTKPTGSWSKTIPTTQPGQYLWTKTVVTYSDGKSTESYSVSRNGSDGSDGADALTLVILSTNGNIFKNTEIATTLSAHVYKGGVEITGPSLTALGTIKWYKDEGATAVATGSELTIQAGDVANQANYTAKLEG